MPLPKPFPGLVLHYAYLWHDEKRRGLEEGLKDRPCLIAAVEHNAIGEIFITVAPITHRAPRNSQHAVQIPAVTKQRLGLDDDSSWIILTEVNRFLWPGPDVRQIPIAPGGQFTYGVIPPALFDKVKASILCCARDNTLLATIRS